MSHPDTPFEPSRTPGEPETPHMPGEAAHGGDAPLRFGLSVDHEGAAQGPRSFDGFGTSGAAASRSVRPSRRTSRVAFFGEAVEEDDPLLGFAPYVHAAPRRNSITPERQRAFIAALAASGIVTQAARVVGASLEALYKLRHRHGAEGFAQAWDKAVDRGMMRLEDCALERAIRGEERPVASQGRIVATYTRYDTGLLLFLLRGRRTARYGKDTDVSPGSPLYEQIRAQIHREYQCDLPSVRAAIDRKLQGLRREVMARRAAEQQDGA
jgi:hypothetical protein